MKTQLKTFLHQFAADENGAAAVEYAILAALIAMAILAAVTNLGTALVGVFNNVANKLT